jgi:UDP-glucose 4-epimerase
MEVLITGGSGFIGSNLARKCLENGHLVTILSKSSSHHEKNLRGLKGLVKIVRKDIRDIGKEEVGGKDYIFHLASTVDNYNIQSDPYLDIEINCKGTIALLEACRKYAPDSRVVYPSTFFVNGNLEALPADSLSACNPLGLYPATKLASEHFCRIYNNTFDMNTVIARITNVFGAGEEGDNKKKAAFNFLINQAIKGEELQLYNGGDFFRDYIYVDDVSSALLILAEKGNKEKTYYIGRGEKIKFKQLIDYIKQELPLTKVRSISPPEFHNRVGIKDFYCDSSELKKLGWHPNVSLREGIKRTIEFYQDEAKK